MLDPSDYPNLQSIYFVGEPLPQKVSDRWSTLMTCYNMYGPTESSCGSTCKRLMPGHKVTIGRPVRTTRIYILDSYKNLAPPGVIGEVYTAGVQVSCGYVGRPEETAKSFSIDTISSRHGQMMYATGDRGYWTETGEVALLGRADRQIKLRGYRLDLNDIELRMVNADADVTAVAVARKGDYLVAMVQPTTIDVVALKSSLRNVLPPQAVPQLLRAVEKFPLVNAGKIDYKAIINAFDVTTEEKKTQQSPEILHMPSVDAREAIISVWREILCLSYQQTLNKNSDFLELGGNSVRQLTLASRLSHVFGRKIPLAQVFKYTHLGDQRSLFQQGGVGAQSPVNDSGCYGKSITSFVSPIEQDWWGKYGIQKGTSSFNVSYACAIGSEVDREKLAHAWNIVLGRHQIFGCVFRKHSETSTLTRLCRKDRPRVILLDDIDLRKEVNRTFNLQEDLPVRILLAPNVVLLVATHIVMDLTCLRVVLQEVETVYCRGLLPRVPKAYSQTKQWKRTISQEDLDFWSKTLSSINHYPLASRTSFNGTSRVCKVPLAVFKSMMKFTARRGITFHQLSLSAVALALHCADSAFGTIVLGAPYLNRDAEDSETVGLFLEPLPIRIEVPESWLATNSHAKNGCHSSWSMNFTQTVRQTSHEALSHAIPWDRLLAHLQVETHHPNVPFIEAMVTFHDDHTPKPSGILGLRPLYTWCEGSKFALMAEFLAINDETLLLRLEYDNDIHDDTKVEKVQGAIIAALQGLSRESDPAEIKCLIEEACTNEARVKIEQENGNERFFGVDLDCL